MKIYPIEVVRHELAHAVGSAFGGNCSEVRVFRPEGFDGLETEVVTFDGMDGHDILNGLIGGLFSIDGVDITSDLAMLEMLNLPPVEQLIKQNPELVQAVDAIEDSAVMEAYALLSCFPEIIVSFDGPKITGIIGRDPERKQAG